MRIHAWVVYSSIKRAWQFMSIYKYLQKELGYVVWLVFFM